MWRPLIRPLLFSLPPEAAHAAAFRCMRMLQAIGPVRQALRSACVVADEILQSRVFGLEFANPVGLAAGLDKDAHLLPTWHALGFGFAEIGTITLRPQPGNPQPRLFRMTADEALINRLGFNNDGSDVVRTRLVQLLKAGRWPQFPVGVNLGKGRDTSLDRAVEDYAALFECFFDLGDYFVMNVSSPNTPGLRELQDKSRLDALFAVLQQKNRARLKVAPRPLLVKVDPDLEPAQLDDVVELCLKHEMAGMIATNTTLGRDGLKSASGQAGGLSGRPLGPRATAAIRQIYQATRGKLPIIGVGGIFSAEDAYEKIRAGAALIQLYTGLIYKGPCLVRRINKSLVGLLQRDGFRNVAEAVGQR